MLKSACFLTFQVKQVNKPKIPLAIQEFCLSLHRPRISGNAEVRPSERRTNGFKQNLARVVVGKPRHSSFVYQGTILLIIMPQRYRSIHLNWHYIIDNKSSCHPLFVNSPHNKKPKA